MSGVFALNVSDQVEKIGDYLGVAAFLGLAALALLYFSQARELRRLREWAGRAPERAAELQERVVLQAQEAARRVSAQPQKPKPAAAAPVAGNGGAAAAPAAPPAPAATT